MPSTGLPKRKRPRAPIDGLANAISALKIAKSIPICYIQNICEGLIAILEVVEQVRQNESDITRFANAANETARLLQEEIHNHTSLPGSAFQNVCEIFYNQICETVIQLDALKASNDRHTFLKYLRMDRTSDAISQCEGALTELRDNLILISTTGTRMDVADIVSKQDTTHSLVTDMHQTLSLHTSSISSLPCQLGGIRNAIGFSAGYTNKRLGELQTEIENQNPLFDGRFRRFIEGDIDIRQELDSHKPTLEKDNRDDVLKTNIAHAGDSTKDRTIRVFRRKTEWKRELDLLKLVPRFVICRAILFNLLRLTRRPNLVQLYGICDSESFLTLIFHRKLVFLENYIFEKDPPVIEEIRLRVNAIRDHQNAHLFLASHHGLTVQSYHHGFYYADENGALCMDGFQPASGDSAWHTPLVYNTSIRLSSVIGPVGLQDPTPSIFDSPISKAHLLEYYNLILWLPSVQLDLRKSQQGTIGIYRPPEWTKLASLQLPNSKSLSRTWAFCEDGASFDERYVAMNPDGSLRISIDTSEPKTFTVLSQLTDESFRTIFYAFFSQASHVSEKHGLGEVDTFLYISTSILRLCYSPHEIALPTCTGRRNTIYLFLPPAVAFEKALSASYYFASDPQGLERVSDSELEVYGITVEHTIGESVFPNLCTPKAMMARRYRFLRDIHHECGFNPYSTQAAEYLGLPIFQLHGVDSIKVKATRYNIEGLAAWNMPVVIMTCLIFFSVWTFVLGVV
ncbi:hypothetical protein DFS33DRAFT_1352911 [Desarmillaria ectypa]|nr:hypothetical protein DFS33DRAFT_1352911 [Desarmillaria ectypa]